MKLAFELLLIICLIWNSKGVHSTKNKVVSYNFSEEVWNDEYKKGLWNYLDTISVERARNSVIIGVFKHKYAFNGTILDVGCGEGVLSDFLFSEERHLYHGIDISDEAIKLARQKRKYLNFSKATIDNFDSAGQLYDMIVFNEVLYYVPDPAATLKKFSNFLNKNGVIVISVWYTVKLDSIRSAIFQVAKEILKPLERIDVSGLTVNKKKKINISFQIEGFRASSTSSPT